MSDITQEELDSAAQADMVVRPLRDEISRLRAEVDRLAPMDMGLCERHLLVLRVGQPYVFRPVVDCESCAAALEPVRDAYGADAGAPNC